MGGRPGWRRVRRGRPPGRRTRGRRAGHDRHPAGRRRRGTTPRRVRRALGGGPASGGATVVARRGRPRAGPARR
ncbi:hypothetical protein ESP62_008790 [Aeromicrobium fastidiosum]|uniref:Uncharacterized protein n=1 Tax=Aeromicrobium fastidiosum TaxID=52699 RepID=A0A641AMD7_9ACTN|nr:hypothetical protein ESP62_008790 [Aeromicrobium fastidiosum]